MGEKNFSRGQYSDEEHCLAQKSIQNTQLPFGTDGDTLCTGSTGTSSKKGKVEDLHRETQEVWSAGPVPAVCPQTATAVP